jgi:hypothetical protein
MDSLSIKQSTKYEFILGKLRLDENRVKVDCLIPIRHIHRKVYRQLCSGKKKGA